MSNAINRQDVSDYDKSLSAWRKAAEGYNADVGTYNASVGKYNAELSKRLVTGSDADGNVIFHDGSMMSPYSENGTFNQADPGKFYNGVGPNGRLMFEGKPTGMTTAKPVVPTLPENKVVAPRLTLQQEKDLTKSDQPMVDAALNGASKRSVFKPEQGLIARAMSGFK